MDDLIFGKRDRRETGEYVLAVLRIVFGFMLIWAFFDKLLGLGMLTTPEAAIVNGGSPTEYYRRSWSPASSPTSSTAMRATPCWTSC